MNNRLTSQVLNWAGATLGLLSIFFVWQRFNKYLAGVGWSRLESWPWAWLGILAIVYCASNFFLALAWTQVLRGLGSTPKQAETIRIYGKSQLAKYIPGNIFHFAGRQGLSMAAGLPAKLIAKSSVVEILLLFLAGSQFVFLILPLSFPGISPLACLVILATLTIFVTSILRVWLGPHVSSAFVWQALFVATSGCIFWGVTQMTGRNEFNMQHVLPIIGAYTIAWLAGLATPGAPAGIGIREAIALVLLGKWMEKDELLTAIVAGRMITIVGDLLFFLISWIEIKKIDMRRLVSRING